MPPKRWLVAAPLPAEAATALAVFPPAFRQVLYNRGIHDPAAARAYLDPSPSPVPSEVHLGMAEAVERILFAIDNGEKITVYGDYDVDGVTATALLVEVLGALGATVEGHIPNRFEEGYGLNLEALSGLAETGTNLVVTVDCGIRSPREAAHARALGMDMIISDHHHPGEELPEAVAVLNPRLQGNPYPDKELSGVGMAWHIARALLNRRPLPGVRAEDWLDLVALGTISDVDPLTGENRYLVREGLAQMQSSKRQGLVSLAGAASVKLQNLTCGDVGFMLGPRLNAAGRIDSAMDALTLLLEKDYLITGRLALRLDAHNRERQERTRRAQESALEMNAAESDTPVLFAFSPEYSSGIVGLVASRLVESRYRPAIVGQIEGETIRASCRSIPEFHITHALDQCEDLLIRHGGHAMAAGFTIAAERLPEFQQRMRAIAAADFAGQELIPTLKADAEANLAGMSLGEVGDMYQLLAKLEPTGQSNPPATFISHGLKVVRARAVGGDGQHLKLTVSAGRAIWDAIAFRQGHWINDLPPTVDLFYSFDENEYNGRRSLQLKVQDLRPAA